MHLEYHAPFWFPMPRKDVVNLEKIQIRNARMIKPWNKLHAPKQLSQHSSI